MFLFNVITGLALTHFLCTELKLLKLKRFLKIKGYLKTSKYKIAEPTIVKNVHKVEK